MPPWLEGAPWDADPEAVASGEYEVDPQAALRQRDALHLNWDEVPFADGFEMVGAPTDHEAVVDRVISCVSKAGIDSLFDKPKLQRRLGATVAERGMGYLYTANRDLAALTRRNPRVVPQADRRAALERLRPSSAYAEADWYAVRFFLEDPELREEAFDFLWKQDLTADVRAQLVIWGYGAGVKATLKPLNVDGALEALTQCVPASASDEQLRTVLAYLLEVVENAKEGRWLICFVSWSRHAGESLDDAGSALWSTASAWFERNRERLKPEQMEVVVAMDLAPTLVREWATRCRDALKIAASADSRAETAPYEAAAKALMEIPALMAQARITQLEIQLMQARIELMQVSLAGLSAQTSRGGELPARQIPTRAESRDRDPRPVQLNTTELLSPLVPWVPVAPSSLSETAQWILDAMRPEYNARKVSARFRSRGSLEVFRELWAATASHSWNDRLSLLYVASNHDEVILPPDMVVTTAAEMTMAMLYDGRYCDNIRYNVNRIFEHQLRRGAVSAEMWALVYGTIWEIISRSDLNDTERATFWEVVCRTVLHSPRYWVRGAIERVAELAKVFVPADRDVPEMLLWAFLMACRGAEPAQSWETSAASLCARIRAREPVHPTQIFLLRRATEGNTRYTQDWPDVSYEELRAVGASPDRLPAGRPR